MNRKGHIGMTLLAFAPIAYYLVSDGKLLLAVVSLGAIHIIEPLPDQDFHIPGLTHRGVSHSLLTVFVVGGVLGACGWLLGEHVFDVVYSVVSTGGHLWNSLLDALPSLSAAVLRGLVPSISLREVVATLEHQAGENLRWSLGIFGFGVGAYGIVAHLLGDVITVRGIKPFLPVSHWRLSLSSLRGDNSVANSVLFGVGVVAIAAVVIATVPGVLLGASPPGTLSPVGVAAGENTTTPAPTPTQNASAANVSSAMVTLSNQTTNGSTVTVERATLPDGGFIVLSNDPYREVGSLTESMIAVSKPLSPGTHRNITIEVNNSPPGGSVNQTALDTTSDYSVSLYRDTNNNTRFEYLTSLEDNDTAYLTGSGTQRRFVSDAAVITASGSNTPTPAAKIRFQNQTAPESTVTVRSVTLPNGGWVVIRNQSYLRGGDPLRTIVGRSQYLSSGTHRNVSVSLTRSIHRPQALAAFASRDTNANKAYDYVRSDGFQDPAYTAHGAIINDTAYVTNPDTAHTTTVSPSAAPTTKGVSTPFSITTSPPSTRDPTPQPTAKTGTSTGGVVGWATDHPLVVGGGTVVVLGGIPTLLRRL